MIIDCDVDEIPRKVETRDKKNSSKISFEYSNIKNHLTDNISDVKNKFVIAKSLEKENLDQAKEIWRSQIVFIDSTLDFYIHEVIKYGIIKMFNGEWTSTQKFENIKVSLKFAIDFAKTPENANFLLGEIDEINQENCFMSYDNIKKQLNIIDITPDASKKTIIDEIYQRRNQIAHQSDRLPENPIKQDISEELVSHYISEIESFISDIEKQILEKS